MMKSLFKIFLIIVFSYVLWGCKKNIVIAEIKTTELIALGLDYAIIQVKTNGSYSFGIYYSETKLPTISDNRVFFSGDREIIDNLKESTTYYWRAFIRAEGVIAYSEVQSFTTLTPTLPIVSTLETINITYHSAVLRGLISDIGLPAYTEKGFYLYTSIDPPIIDTIITVAGNETGYFEKTATNLTPNTTYYVSAYAINKVGVVYDKEIKEKFTTAAK